MTWVVLSLLTAFASASTDAWTKKFFGDRHPVEMAVYPLAYSFPLFLISLFFVQIPDLDSVFWLNFMLSIPLNCVSFIIYMSAIRISPLSLTLPFLALTPVFMICTGFLVLGEWPTVWAALGMGIIVVGGYLLNAPAASQGIWAPLRAVGKEKGSLLMIAVAFIYSISAVVGKKAILHSSPLFFGMLFFVLQNFLLVGWAAATGRIGWPRFFQPRSVFCGVLVGLFYYAHVLCHVLAISMTQAAYMISLKRLSILFGMIYGGVLFREEHLGWRLIGGACMVVGAAAIALGGE